MGRDRVRDHPALKAMPDELTHLKRNASNLRGVIQRSGSRPCSSTKQLTSTHAITLSVRFYGVRLHATICGEPFDDLSGDLPPADPPPSPTL